VPCRAVPCRAVPLKMVVVAIFIVKDFSGRDRFLLVDPLNYKLNTTTQKPTLPHNL
jgi:hypothetical protein